jgi:cation transport regulator ChaC
MAFLEQVRPAGELVTLQPLRAEHHDGLVAAARDGSLRETVVFSVIASEWPAVRNELRRRLAAGTATTGPGP